MQSIDKCPITQSLEKVPYLDLGNIPLVNNLEESKDASLSCSRYPLNINFFPDSGLTALGVSIDSEILFKTYFYKSSVSKPYVQHCSTMFTDIEKYVDIKEDDLFVDIGGNDGTLLYEFKNINRKNCNYLNIDPSENLSEISKARGINTFTNFFGPAIADSIAAIKKAKVITSTNVFQHLQDIQNFVKGVSIMLADNGVWVLEFPYWSHDLETGQFDQLYHEHVYYYNVTPLWKLFIQHELEIKKIEPQKIHGGTLRLYIAKQNSNYKVESQVFEYLENERKYNKEYLTKWSDEIKSYITKCKNDILEIKNAGHKIAAFGAAAKGCTFLNSAKIDYNIIEYVIDDTDLKQGKFVPGVGLAIVSREKLKTNPVDYILILPHNFSEHIKQSLINEGYTGKFLQYLPHKIDI